MRVSQAIASAMVAFCALGCAAQRVEYDHTGAREAVTDLQTEQIFDNLVRLKKGLPIVHIDYTKVQARSQETLSGGIDFTAVDTDNLAQVAPSGFPPDKVHTASVDQDTIGAKTSASNMQSWLQLDAAPAIGSQHAPLYAAYLAYVEKGPSYLAWCANEPDTRSVVMKRRYSDGWYYIPNETYAIKAFRKLSLAALGYSASAKKRTTTKIKSFGEAPVHHGDHTDVRVHLSRPVANVDGLAKINLGGLDLRLVVRHRDEVPVGSKTSSLVLSYPDVLRTLLPFEVFTASVIGKDVIIEVDGDGAVDGSHGIPSEGRGAPNLTTSQSLLEDIRESLR